MCGDKGQILYFYDRGPGDPQGNQYINCPLCESHKKIEELEKRLLKEHLDRVTKKPPALFHGPFCEKITKLVSDYIQHEINVEKAWREYEEANYWIVNDLLFFWRDLYRKLRDHIRKQNDQPKGKWGGDFEEVALKVYKHNDLLERRDEARKRLKELGEI